jgi:hypothetical protein
MPVRSGFLSRFQKGFFMSDASVKVTQIHREPRFGGQTALVLTIQYEPDREAEATLLLKAGQMVPPNADSIRREILRLGQALQTAAQSPQAIPALRQG